MKKVFVLVILFIVAMCNFAHAGEEIYYGDLRDHCIPGLIDDFNEKYEGGEKIFENGYTVINDFCVYCTEGRLYLSDFGIDSNEKINHWDLEKKMTEMLRDAGLAFAKVDIIQVGYEPEYPVYKVEIGAMMNINEWPGNDEVGSGFIKDGLVYYWMEVLTTIE